MNNHEQERLKEILKQALPPVEGGAEPVHDLWPSVLRRVDSKPAAPWFDWALAGGVLLFIAFFPAAIPVFLYYL